MRFLQITESGRVWYGGAQEWCRQSYMKRYGCGVIGCANVILHLQKGTGRELSKEAYMELVEVLRKQYLPVIPKIGMNGLVMMAGLNWYFIRNHMNYRAWWGCLPGSIWRKAEHMLENGIPVVLSVGPNFPGVWGNHRVTLYQKNGKSYHPVTTTKAHYVTITDLDESWITLSSWGNKYYMKKSEYQSYVKKYSSFIFSNILVIHKRSAKS